jgi:hypothetical protein
MAGYLVVGSAIGMVEGSLDVVPMTLLLKVMLVTAGLTCLLASWQDALRARLVAGLIGCSRWSRNTSGFASATASSSGKGCSC